MAKIINENRWGTTYVFDVVTEFPHGYTIWNIGRSNFPYECYIPLCVADDSCHIGPSTLKALKVANEDFALFLLKEAGKHPIDRNKYFKLATEAGIIK